MKWKLQIKFKLLENDKITETSMKSKKRNTNSKQNKKDTQKDGS